LRIRWKLLTLPVLLGACTSLLHGARAAPPAPAADRIVIYKSKREMQLFSGSKLLKTYRVALGPVPKGAKACEGDGKTPEGTYRIIGRNAKSAFHKSLRVSYPSEHDRTRAAAAGCSPGGDIMIHGLPNGYGWVGAGHRAKDWTAGCIAVTDAEIEEIWQRVANGTVVEIRP
jgi:murein L,D-transpeptidase YafK